MHSAKIILSVSKKKFKESSFFHCGPQRIENLKKEEKTVDWFVGAMLMPLKAILYYLSIQWLSSNCFAASIRCLTKGLSREWDTVNLNTFLCFAIQMFPHIIVCYNDNVDAISVITVVITVISHVDGKWSRSWTQHSTNSCLSQFWLCNRIKFVTGTAGKELYLSEFFCGLLQHL